MYNYSNHSNHSNQSNHNFSRILLTGVAMLSLFAIASGAVRADQTPKTKFTATQAEAAALKKYKGGKVTGKTALENEDGKWQYAVMVKASGKTHEVMVDANTGKISSEEVVTAQEEAKEKKAEEAKKSGKATKGMKKAKDTKAEKSEKEDKEEDEKNEKK